jgi:hypothetical protein
MSRCTNGSVATGLLFYFKINRYFGSIRVFDKNCIIELGKTAF